MFSQDKHYKLNLLTHECNVTANPRPCRSYSVPPDARFRGTADVGAAGVPDEHVIVNVFDGRDEDNNPYYMTMTGADCLPIQTGFFSNETGAVVRYFYDVSIGISDPDVFIPPKECV
ncbi:mammalian ependymin-related protein 1-like [Haliotis rufescens]|uniref:mammalian ependymin-related protein 1-like n=1 Tax=Haliotis rufescens TaxID=6454 RepID=UPI00201EDEE1|nr:mammalian ependymin-related protein 1-like [Haliotis rufescens]